MQYEIYVQNKLYKTVPDAPESMALVWQVTNDKDTGKIAWYDPSKPAHIVVKPIE